MAEQIITGSTLIDSAFERTTVNVQSGGKVINTTLNTSSFLKIHSEGIASRTTVNATASMTVFQGGSALDTTVAGGHVRVSSGGVLDTAVLSGNGTVNVFSGGRTADASVGSGGRFNLGSSGGYAGGFAERTVIHAAGSMWIFSDGYAVDMTVSSGGYLIISGGGSASDLNVQSGGILQIAVTSATRVQGTVNGTALEIADGYVSDYTVHSRGKIEVYAGASAADITLQRGSMTLSGGCAVNTVVNSGGQMRAALKGFASNTFVNSGGKMYVSSGGSARNTFIDGNGSMLLYSTGVHRGTLTLSEESTVTVKTGGIIDFTLEGRMTSDDFLISDLSRIEGAPVYTITVAADLKYGKYKLARNAGSIAGSLSIGDGAGNYGSITVNGEDFIHEGKIYSLDQNDGCLTLTIDAREKVLTGDASGVYWQGIAGEIFTVEFSKDSFDSTLQIRTSSHAVDTWQVPGGIYQWRVSGDGEGWHRGNDVTVPAPAVPARLVSDADGDLDLFFANADGVWTDGYAAQHNGIVQGWQGTGEQVMLAGKNKIADIFAGSADAGVLVLTDDVNGDALFLDDMFTAFGDEARLAQIDEIRAGAGDDVVDLTSQRFAYAGGVTIYGGLGNDTLWANSGHNILFGDGGDDRIVGGTGDDVITGGTGNDSLSGGGGNDIFCFGKDWGTDTVEQLADGTVTLWFENGTESGWDASTLTYTDGTNSVTVTGVSEVTLKFGGDVSGLPEDVFADAASEKIFENQAKGMLA